MRRVIRYALLVALITWGFPVDASEKYWIVRNAELIVIGVNHVHRYPWFDGVHLSGTIDVREVLKGSTAAQELQYRLVERCDWLHREGQVGCDLRAFFQTRLIFDGIVGIWRLRHADDAAWTAADWYGYLPLERRQEYEPAMNIKR